jgi:hypothetical protein
MQYFNINHLLNNTYMNINRALLKHGHENFSLTILEYCEPDKCLEREDCYFKLLKPEYNISQNPSAPFLGRKHSDETKQKMSDAAKKIEHPGHFKKGVSKPKPEGSGKPSKKIEVQDLVEGTRTLYNSMSEAARALNINKSVIVLYFIRNQVKAYKGRYIFTEI